MLSSVLRKVAAKSKIAPSVPSTAARAMAGTAQSETSAVGEMKMLPWGGLTFSFIIILRMWKIDSRV